MKSTSKWIDGMRSVVDNGRTHSQIMDLPPAKGGVDQAPTAIEVCVMSFAGCVTTIFAVVAKKMRLDFSMLEVIADAQQPEGAATVTKVDVNLIIKSDAQKEKIEKCFEMTCNTCPVGVLFREAGVEVNKTLTIKE